MQGMRTPTLPHRWDERTWKEGFDRGYYEGLEEGQALGWRTLRSQILTRLDHVRSDLRLGLCLAATPSEVWEEMVWVIEDAVREYREGGVCGGRADPADD